MYYWKKEILILSQFSSRRMIKGEVRIVYKNSRRVLEKHLESNFCYKKNTKNKSDWK